MRRLYFGPWAGEFGWALMWAIPVLRKIAHGFDHVTVCAPNGQSWLWEFAHRYEAIRTDGGYSYIEGRVLSPVTVPEPEDGLEVVSTELLWKKHGGRERNFVRGRGKAPPKEWRQYVGMLDRGKDRTPTFDVLVAFRGPKDGAPWKEYSRQDADTLVRDLDNIGLEVGAIGGPDNYLPEGARDLRGIPIPQLCGLMRAAVAVVGPSSAPLHLAALSGARKIVTWYAGPEDLRFRYEVAWNPFGVPVRYIGGASEAPDPAAVLAEVLP